MKIKEPRIAKRMRVINAVKDPFLAMFILSSLENLSVITTSKGVIPIGFIKVNKVVRQRIKN